MFGHWTLRKGSDSLTTFYPQQPSLLTSSFTNTYFIECDKKKNENGSVNSSTKQGHLYEKLKISTYQLNGKILRRQVFELGSPFIDLNGRNKSGKPSPVFLIVESDNKFGQFVVYIYGSNPFQFCIERFTLNSEEDQIKVETEYHIAIFHPKPHQMELLPTIEDDTRKSLPVPSMTIFKTTRYLERCLNDNRMGLAVVTAQSSNTVVGVDDGANQDQISCLQSSFTESRCQDVDNLKTISALIIHTCTIGEMLQDTNQKSSPQPQPSSSSLKPEVTFFFLYEIISDADVFTMMFLLGDVRDQKVCAEVHVKP
jgi:hypothetical protein